MVYQGTERRRTIRISRSALLNAKLDNIDRPTIKIAENRDELQQAFSLVYQEYLDSGYIVTPRPLRILFNIHHFLPKTVVFIVKSFLTVISTLSHMADDKYFGLPMDALYKKELDELRAENRKIAEVSGLATVKSFRWQNLFMFLCRIMYWYSQHENINDLCITINPKHVRFYNDSFLFEQFGPEKYYPRVNAPAVPMRLNMDDIEGKLKEVYNAFDFECNLYSYFHKINKEQHSGIVPELTEKFPFPHTNKSFFKKETAKYFFDKDKTITNGLSPACLSYIKSLHPELAI